MNNDENKTTNNIQLDLTGLPANLLYSPEELERWLDDTSVPLSDDDIKAMSSYFDSENFQYEESNLCDIININSKTHKI